MQLHLYSKVNSLAILLVIVVMFSSCKSGSDECSGKQVTCPSFDNPLAILWLPYSFNQQLIYASTNAKNDTFTMRSIDLSKSFSSTVSGRNPFCSAEGIWQTSLSSYALLDTNLYFKVQQNIDQYTSSQDIYALLQVKSFYVDGSGYADTGLIRNPSNSNYSSVITKFQSSLTLGNKVFTNVQSIQTDTTNSKLAFGKVYKIYIAKNAGLIGYQNYPENKLWVKQ